MDENLEYVLVGTLLGICIGFILFFVIIGIFGDELDVVNVEGLGEKICGRIGQEYNYRTYEDGTNVPTFYCRERVYNDGAVI